MFSNAWLNLFSNFDLNQKSRLSRSIVKWPVRETLRLIQRGRLLLGNRSLGPTRPGGGPQNGGQTVPASRRLLLIHPRQLAERHPLRLHSRLLPGRPLPPHRHHARPGPGNLLHQGRRQQVQGGNDRQARQADQRLLRRRHESRTGRHILFQAHNTFL